MYLCELWNAAAVAPGLTGGLRRERGGKTLLRLSEAAFDAPRKLLTITFRFYVLRGRRLVEEFDSIHRARTYGLDEMRDLFRRAGLRVEALVGVEPMKKAWALRPRGTSGSWPSRGRREVEAPHWGDCFWGVRREAQGKE